MKIVGYGICGPDEPYLEQTLKEFARLCDETIICFNHATQKEKDLVAKYGFLSIDDDREWGKLQWQIKEDFVTNHVAKLNPDLCVCLDMDEVFDKHLTKEGLHDLYKNEFEAYYFYIINLWDDGYQKERSFWNIRAWKFRKDLGTKWPRKNLHCGLGPEWTWSRAYYTPYILKHYGLKDKERREKKAQRYDKYDPKARFIAKEYYDSLRSNPHVEPFDEDALHKDVVQYVHDIKQKYVKPMQEKEEIVYIKTKAGEVVPVPKRKLDDYTRQGCEVVADQKTLEDTLDNILDTTPSQEEEVEVTPPATFICGTCGYKAISKRALHAHGISHKRAQKKRWSFDGFKA